MYNKHEKLTKEQHTHSEDTVFLHVNHIGESSTWGNVYVSNALGLGYALSLPHNRRATNGKCDFEKVEGIEGIYLSNYIDNADYKTETDDYYNDMGGGSGSAGNSRAVAAAGAAGLGKAKAADIVRTVITFDKGAVWSYLRPPRYDANGAPLRCLAADCSLHLHGK